MTDLNRFPSLGDRMRALAQNGHPRAAELVKAAAEMEQAATEFKNAASVVKYWARARRLWCEITGEAPI